MLDNNRASLDIASLPKKLAYFANEFSRVTDSPPEYVIGFLLSMVSGLIGHSRFIKVNDAGWCEPSNLFSIIVGSPGSGKSPLLSAMQAPLSLLDNDSYERNRVSLEEYQIKCDQYDAMTKQVRAASDVFRPIKPICHQRMISDITVEGLTTILAGNPNGVLLLRDELAGFFAGFDRYHKKGSSSDAYFYCSAYSGGSYRVQRQSGVDINLPYVALSLTGCLTSINATKFLTSDQTSGFSPRFLCFNGGDLPVCEDMNIKTTTIHAEWGSFIDLLAVNTFNAQPVSFSFSDTAFSAANSYRVFCKKEGMATTNPAHSEAYSKMFGRCCRIALAIQTFLDIDAKEIGIEAFNAAKIISEYSHNCWKDLRKENYHQIEEATDINSITERKILAYVSKDPGKNRSFIRRYIRCTTEAFNKAFNLLATEKGVLHNALNNGFYLPDDFEKLGFIEIDQVVPRKKSLMTMDLFLSHFKGVKKNGNGSFQVLCPAHDDQQNSLTITPGGNKIKIKCHAGCLYSQVISAVGLKASDLFFKCDNVLDSVKSERVAEKVDSAPIEPLVQESVYSYKDVDGLEVFQTVRFKPKTFRQRRRENGGWIWNLKDVALVPYNLPAVIKSKTVFFVEGEKSADRLTSLGLTASCSPLGAGKFRAYYAQYFKDKEVIILPDNDAPGLAHAEAVSVFLEGVADSVRIFMLPGLPDKGDVCDFFDALIAQGASNDDQVEYLELILESNEDADIVPF